TTKAYFSYKITKYFCFGTIKETVSGQLYIPSGIIDARRLGEGSSFYLSLPQDGYPQHTLQYLAGTANNNNIVLRRGLPCHKPWQDRINQTKRNR
ncbi:MAG: hypothetical protein KAT83_01100, partial [Candidatus Aenigmarchaeota archaeon]|nr:hypothetical protein [Candidatus Aenigmarchaeota archaeon]